MTVRLTKPKTKNGLAASVKSQSTALWVGLSVVTFFIGVVLLPRLNTTLIAIDSFGYLNSAATMTGLDWSNISQFLDYYGYGYSILLAPLFLLRNANLVFGGAIVLNALMLCGIFWLACASSGWLCPEIETKIRMWLSFGATMYIGNVSASKLIISDLLVVLLFWALTYLLLSVSQRVTYTKVALLALLSAYIYVAHQRTLGVVVAVGFAIVALYFQKRIQWQHVLLFGACLLVLLAIQSVYIKPLFTVKNEMLLAADSNDYGSMLGSVLEILTNPVTLINYIAAILGQVYYMMVATLCFFGWGVVLCVRTLWGAFRERKNPDKTDKAQSFWPIAMFLLLAFVFTLGITSIKLPYPGRVDHLAFGRYSEFAVGPLILLSLGYFSTEKSFVAGSVWKTQYWLMAGTIALSALVTVRQVIFKPELFDGISAIGLAYFYQSGIGWVATAVLCCLFSLGAVCVLAYCPGKRLPCLVVAVFISCLWVGQAVNVVAGKAATYATATGRMIHVADALAENEAGDVLFVREELEEDSPGRTVAVELLQVYAMQTQIQYLEIDSLWRYRLEDGMVIVMPISLEEEKADSFGQLEPYLLFLDTVAGYNIYRYQPA